MTAKPISKLPAFPESYEGYTDLSGRKRTVYAVTLVELREKEKQIERDLQDGIDSSLSIRIWVTAVSFIYKT